MPILPYLLFKPSLLYLYIIYLSCVPIPSSFSMSPVNIF
jgi:hypothetical protein